jgi:hypothetical protein
MHTLYLGPSWAVQSFESLSGINDPVKTNLAKELRIPKCTLLARYAHSNFDQLECARHFMENNSYLDPFRLVFVTANALQDGDLYYNMSQIDFAKMFLRSQDPLDLIFSLEEKFYQQINQLDIPVALIGAHTDVKIQNQYNNITVIHPSWQNFLGSCCGLNSFYGWAADVAHRWLRGIVIPRVGNETRFDLGANPSATVVNEIHKIVFDVWGKLEQNQLFKGVHPNILGNQLFAKEIADPLNQWIDNVV